MRLACATKDACSRIESLVVLSHHAQNLLCSYDWAISVNLEVTVPETKSRSIPAVKKTLTLPPLEAVISLCVVAQSSL